MVTDLGELLREVGAAPGDARAAVVEDLVRRGCTAEEIREAHARGRLSLLPLERVLVDEGSQTLEQIAAEHGVELDALVATRRALGLPAEPDQPVYGEAIAEHAERLRFALEAGMPLDALVAINRVVARAMVTVAGASRDAIQALLADRALDEGQRALRAAEAAEALAPQFERVLTYAYREHVRELVRQAASEQLLAADAGADVREVAVAFADLVGFTRLGDELSPQQLGRVAQRLEGLANDALRPGVVVVKTIGDAVMLASPQPSALVGTVLDLLAAAEGEAQSGALPRLRAGAAAGPAVYRTGDWYGRTVNLASRLTALAEPGTLAADERLREHAGDCAEWVPVGAHAVRGFEQPVAVYRPRGPHGHRPG